jgi:hypothetical protein
LALASPLLVEGATHRRRKESIVVHKRMFKVLCPIERDGVTRWVKLGLGHANKDESINVYFDSLPLNGRIQIRAYTEEELRELAERRARFAARRATAPGSGGASAPSSDTGLPF